MRSRILLVAAATALVAACADDRTSPVGPSEQPSQPLPATASVDQMDRAIPGFGGFFYDEAGAPTVFLLPSADRGLAQLALGNVLQSRGQGPEAMRVLVGSFVWRDLTRWRGDLTPAVLGLDGVYWTDADEATNRVRVGVADLGTVPRVRAELLRLGIPAEAVVVEPSEPMVPMVTLREAVRPTVGGLQINFPGFLCTLGFNALDGTQRSFITNSHCTANQGGVDNTPYYQPLQSTNPTRLAVEVEDPVFTASPGCPAGRVCRRSDASRAAYDNAADFQLGRIARTASSKNGSLEIVGDWTITGDDATTDNFPIGTVLNKVGRTTGWSQGKVIQTCVDYGVSGTNIVVFCQTSVKAKVNSGDSGSPVFQITGGTNVTLVGILWGGGAGSFAFSPLKNIEQDLGNLTVR